ncbi:Fic family protein [Vibrio furnissii]|uniref:Fic/DOC family protein n=2 Tax=Vibrio furnissii TaxID=29494 RepID=UPI001302B56C|nr:Fic family protein [Vibrio furnissii]MCG6211144.1 Fic family protein [Vibrio furnissii]WJG23699.1 Fic family protein [Vibrio furnissii]HDM8046990.1 Fic family protein [Vibrio fluvialis]
MRDKYGVNQDPYCYPGSDVLINLLNLRDADALAEAESQFVHFRYMGYVCEINALEDFTLEHFLHLHHVLFQDIYSWAGQLRDVDISKGNTHFCNCQFIGNELTKQLKRLPALRKCEDRYAAVALTADIFCEINVIHPFREGNGRATRFFFEELLFVAGYEIEWPTVSKESWIKANVDGVYGDLKGLRDIFNQAIKHR